MSTGGYRPSVPGAGITDGDKGYGRGSGRNPNAIVLWDQERFARVDDEWQSEFDGDLMENVWKVFDGLNRRSLSNNDHGYNVEGMRVPSLVVESGNLTRGLGANNSMKVAVRFPHGVQGTATMSLITNPVTAVDLNVQSVALGPSLMPTPLMQANSAGIQGDNQLLGVAPVGKSVDRVDVPADANLDPAARCFLCGSFGHQLESCKSKVVADQEAGLNRDAHMMQNQNVHGSSMATDPVPDPSREDMGRWEDVEDDESEAQEYEMLGVVEPASHDATAAGGLEILFIPGVPVAINNGLVHILSANGIAANPTFRVPRLVAMEGDPQESFDESFEEFNYK
ncbi:hypothetical protein NE237_002205 [Protea cynaroides]|uniref:CCHC-type domain-containing protein n=1 Tax=Protea cynaroides TaxID=273540 RepID=A0A9Q0QZ63_9MAGN|nr:hypothetical protein NE237_002205 [Protea cynaroides]